MDDSKNDLSQIKELPEEISAVNIESPNSSQEYVEDFTGIEDMPELVHEEETSSPSLETEEAAIEDEPAGDLSPEANFDFDEDLNFDETSSSSDSSDLNLDASLSSDSELEEAPVEETVQPAPPDPVEEIREFAEEASEPEPLGEASYPFHLKIIGFLSDAEREKLITILNQYQVGIREVDLEPQFESGQILIPQISEYAGIVIMQAMRDVAVDFEFGPASENSFDKKEYHLDSISTPKESDHPAESLPVSTTATLDGTESYQILDAVTASATLTSKEMAIESSAEFEHVVERLKRQLKYRAYHKKGSGIVHFSVEVTPLSPRTHYRISVMGSVIQSKPRDH